MSQRTFLITGCAGFVGHHLVEAILKADRTNKIIGVDSLTYAGSLDRLRDIKMSDLPGASSVLDNIKMYTWDFRQPAEPNLVKELQDVTHVIHLGAASHVDNSVADPMLFVQANVVGTVNVMNLARQLPKLELFVQFSTDETSGSAPMDPSFPGFKERERYLPSNPYAGSKAAAEMMVLSFANTYGLPCIITNTMNVYGQRQHPEKFVPLVIRTALEGGKVMIHSAPDKKQAGMRTYIHARNVADAVLFLVNNVKITNPREVESYNVVGEEEVDNLTMAKLIQEYTSILAEQNGRVAVGAEFELIDFHSARPHHDTRYRLDGSKMRALGWVPPKTFHESLRENINWYMQGENIKWLHLVGS